jgi:hypothetical protein
MHVAVDLDDVVLEFMPSVMRSFALEFGVELPYDGAPWGDDAEAFSQHPLFLAAGYENWWGWLRDREWLWATFPAVPGAIGSVKQLREMGHYVECVTSKPVWAEHNVWKWLGKWRPAFNRVTIVGLGQSKVSATQADLIIDDKLATCQEFVRSRRGAIWFNRGPRSHTPQTFAVNEANNWEEVMNFVRYWGWQ